jgi:hypothetical protein
MVYILTDQLHFFFLLFNEYGSFNNEYKIERKRLRKHWLFVPRFSFLIPLYPPYLLAFLFILRERSSV